MIRLRIGGPYWWTLRLRFRLFWTLLVQAVNEMLPIEAPSIKLRSGVFNLCCGFTVMPVKPSDHASNIFNPCRCPCAEESGKAGVTWDIHTLKGGVTSHPAAAMLQCSYCQVCEMFGHPTTLLDPGLQSAARHPATLCRLH